MAFTSSNRLQHDAFHLEICAFLSRGKTPREAIQHYLNLLYPLRSCPLLVKHVYPVAKGQDYRLLFRPNPFTKAGKTLDLNSLVQDLYIQIFAAGDAFAQQISRNGLDGFSVPPKAEMALRLEWDTLAMDRFMGGDDEELEGGERSIDDFVLPPVREEDGESVAGTTIEDSELGEEDEEDDVMAQQLDEMLYQTELHILEEIEKAMGSTEIEPLHESASEICTKKRRPTPTLQNLNIFPEYPSLLEPYTPLSTTFSELHLQDADVTVARAEIQDIFNPNSHRSAPVTFWAESCSTPIPFDDKLTQGVEISDETADYSDNVSEISTYDSSLLSLVQSLIAELEAEVDSADTERAEYTEQMGDFGSYAFYKSRYDDDKEEDAWWEIGEETDGEGGGSGSEGSGRGSETLVDSESEREDEIAGTVLEAIEEEAEEGEEEEECFELDAPFIPMSGTAKAKATEVLEQMRSEDCLVLPEIKVTEAEPEKNEIPSQKCIEEVWKEVVDVARVALEKEYKRNEMTPKLSPASILSDLGVIDEGVLAYDFCERIERVLSEAEAYLAQPSNWHYSTTSKLVLQFAALTTSPHLDFYDPDIARALHKISILASPLYTSWLYTSPDIFSKSECTLETLCGRVMENLSEIPSNVSHNYSITSTLLSNAVNALIGALSISLQTPRTLAPPPTITSKRKAIGVTLGTAALLASAPFALGIGGVSTLVAAGGGSMFGAGVWSGGFKVLGDVVIGKVKGKKGEDREKGKQKEAVNDLFDVYWAVEGLHKEDLGKLENLAVLEDAMEKVANLATKI